MSSSIGIARFLARVCSLCERAWPNEMAYEICPYCREETKGSFDKDKLPPDEEEVLRLKAHAEFGWWLYENDRL